MNCNWDMIKVILGDSIQTENFTISETIIVAAYMTMTFVIVNGYLGALFAFMTVPKYLHPPIDTVEELLASGKKWINVGSADYKTFEFFELQGFGFEKQMEIFPEVKNEHHILTSMRLLYKHPEKYVFIKNYGAVQNLAAYFFSDPKGDIPFHFSKETIRDTGYTVMFLPKYSSYTHAFHMTMLHKVPIYYKCCQLRLVSGASLQYRRGDERPGSIVSYA